MCPFPTVLNFFTIIKKFVFRLAYISYITNSSCHLNPRMYFLHLPYFHTAHFPSSPLHPTHSSSFSPSFIPPLFLFLHPLSPHPLLLIHPTTFPFSVGDKARLSYGKLYGQSLSMLNNPKGTRLDGKREREKKRGEKGEG